MKHVEPSAISGAIELKDGEDDSAAVVTKALAEYKAALEAKLKEIEAKAGDSSKVAARLDSLEARLNRPGAAAPSAEGAEAAAIERKAINAYFHGNAQALDDVERKTLNLGTPASGGYLSAPEYSRTIREKLVQFSPMRSVAAQMSIGGTSVFIPVENAAADGGWVTETGARPETEPTFSQIEVKVHEYAAIVPVSLQLIEDGFVDLSAYVQNHLTKRFGLAESAAFVTGDGNGKPLGFMHSSVVGGYAQIVANQDKSDLVAKLIEQHYALPSPYAVVASYAMNRKTMGVVRAALDTADAGVSWSDSAADGTPARLFGRPVLEFPHMADFAPAVPADTFPIAFGDFATAYQIVDRVAIMFRLDDLTGADNGIVKVRARMRVGGKPTLAEAVNVLKSDTP